MTPVLGRTAAALGLSVDPAITPAARRPVPLRVVGDAGAVVEVSPGVRPRRRRPGVLALGRRRGRHVRRPDVRTRRKRDEVRTGAVLPRPGHVPVFRDAVRASTAVRATVREVAGPAI